MVFQKIMKTLYDAYFPNAEARRPGPNTVDGLPVDFAIAPADTDDREVLALLSERGRYPIILGDKGDHISEQLQRELLETEDTLLLPTLRRNQKRQYDETQRPRCRISKTTRIKSQKFY
jgi:hypothetical protein